VNSQAVIHSCQACRCQHVHTSHFEAWVTTVINDWKSNNIAHRPIMAILIRVLKSLSFGFVQGIIPFYFHRLLMLWYEFIVSRYWSVDSYLSYVFANIGAAALVMCTGSAVVIQLSRLGHQPLGMKWLEGYFIRGDRSGKRSLSLLNSIGNMQYQPNIKLGWTS
jgi:hypothetical protein